MNKTKCWEWEDDKVFKVYNLRGVFLATLLLALSVGTYLWWSSKSERPADKLNVMGWHLLVPESMGITQPIPSNLVFDAKKVALGGALFDEKMLSADGTIACSNCHVLQAGGTDNMARSVGINGEQGGINAPTVLNSGFNFVQFWDGRAATLEDQIDGPVQHPKEMGATWPQVLDKLKNSPRYQAAFAEIYPDKVTVANIKDALATFERSLVTPNSRFDRYLRGDSSVLSEQEKRGYALFQERGCVACHQGINLGGNMYERMGLMGDYFGDRGGLTEADNGRFNVTRKEEDRYYFRVPSLRNVAKTAPYFHDGNAADLHSAVSIMARYQLGRVLEEDEIDAIVAFLHTLTGELQGHPL
ncbi:cytochrome-c peroxidase [Ferriphaselus sp. R-1]|uniref:cytochrome-c peroxidase n=1 Tax=Ferriphaselus sp. R-1 TaxID=1485544 RepID=UPI001F3E3F48|nr:cytochrome-c peroxidase [Ferriphaselus sp. R-1]